MDILDATIRELFSRPSTAFERGMAAFVSLVRLQLGGIGQCLPLVVLYAFDSSAGRGYGYIPGRSDPHFQSNVRTILRGVEGSWFHAWTLWDSVAGPLITKARPAAFEGHPPQPNWSEDDRRKLLAKAQSGDAGSQMWLAAAYEQGWFGDASIPGALKWYRKSASKGNPDAQNKLGRMYEDV